MNYCRLIKKQEKLKKKNWKNVGINPIFFILFALIPIIIVIFIIVISDIVYDYSKQKYEEYKINEQLKKESIYVEQSIEQSIQLENELKKEIIKQESIRQSKKEKEELEQRIVQQEYEDKIIKNKVPYGTMVRNNKTKIVGRVISYQGNRLFTNTDYYFDLQDDLSYPSHIEEIGIKDYLSGLDKLQKVNDKKLRELALKLQEEEKVADTEYTKSLFKLDNGYNKHYFKCNGQYERVKKIEGFVIYTTKGNTYNSKTDKIEEVNYIEYDQGLIEENKNRKERKQ